MLKNKLKLIVSFYNFIKRGLSFILVLDFYYLIKGIFIFKIQGNTPGYSYYAMRRLYSRTNGRLNDFISWLQIFRHPKYLDVIPNGILGKLSEQEVNDIAHQIRENGYYIADKQLNQDTIDRIVHFCKNSPAQYLTLSSEQYQQLSHDKVVFNNSAPVSPIYKFNMQQIFENQDLLNLIIDQSLLAVAQEYLNCSPVVDLVSLWWSAPFHGKGTSEAAQQYHHDMDRIKFLKVFIYLTNVNSENGPHCYVKGSHIRKPKALVSDGRKSDATIALHYPESEIQELCGLRGTIIIADTRGLHKGKPLTNGNRLLFQIEFSNSLFGANYPKVRTNQISNVSQLTQLVDKYPRTYSQILLH